MSRRGWLLFAALGLIWGVPYLLIRVAVQDYSPVFVACARTLLGAVILLPIALRRKAFGPLLAHWRIVLVYTLVEISGPWVLIGIAETRLNSSTTGLLIAVVPLFAAVILAVTGNETFDLRRVFGLALGFAGVATLVGLDIQIRDLFAVGALMLTALGYAIGPIIINRRLSGLDPIGVVASSLALASLSYLPVIGWHLPRRFTLDASLSVVGLAVVCTVAAFLILFALIAEVGPGRATVITYINPAVAIVLGALILDEPLTIGMVIGFPLVILGSILGTARARSSAARRSSVGSSSQSEN